MNILLTESQFNLILESTENIDNFVKGFMKMYPTTLSLNNFGEFFKNSIEKSGCQHITFGRFNIEALGLSLDNGVVINERIQYYFKLPMALYVIFHEIAHQYQYKKYGIDLMYKPYRNDSDFVESINIIREREIVADEYANRKVREFIKMGFIDPKNYKKQDTYKNASIEDFKDAYKQIFDEIGDAKDSEKIREKVYNSVIKTIPNYG